MLDIRASRVDDGFVACGLVGYAQQPGLGRAGEMRGFFSVSPVDSSASVEAAVIWAPDPGKRIRMNKEGAKRSRTKLRAQHMRIVFYGSSLAQCWTPVFGSRSFNFPRLNPPAAPWVGILRPR